VDEAARRVSILEDELVVACQARDEVEEKFPCVAAQAAMADQQQEAAEEQCERLVHELTF
jgi:hypothetical protein